MGRCCVCAVLLRQGAAMRAQVEPKTAVTSFQLRTTLLERGRAVARRRDCSMAAAVRAGLRLWLATQDEAGKRP